MARHPGAVTAGGRCGHSRISIGAFVLDQSGRITFTNQTAEEIASEGDRLQLTHSSLRAATPSETSALQRLVGGVLLGGSNSEPFTLARPSGRRPLEVWAAPLRRDSSMLGGATAAAVVFVSDPGRRHVPNGIRNTVACRLGVDHRTVTGWERTRHDPAVEHIPQVLFFLGHQPFPPPQPPAERFPAARCRRGPPCVRTSWLSPPYVYHERCTAPSSAR